MERKPKTKKENILTNNNELIATGAGRARPGVGKGFDSNSA